MRTPTRMLATAAVATLALAAAAVPAGSDEGDDADTVEPTAVEAVTGYAAGGQGTVFISGDGGPINIDFGPTPEVDLPPEGGGPFTDSVDAILVEIPGGQPEPWSGPTEVSTEGAAGPDGWAASSASVEEPLLDLALGLLEVECSADVETGPAGSTTVTDGEWYDGTLPENPEPGTTFDFEDSFDVGSGVVDITAQMVLNEQTVDDDTITVVGVQFTLVRTFTPTDGEPILIEDWALTYGITTCGVTPASPPPPAAAAAPAQLEPRFTG